MYLCITINLCVACFTCLQSLCLRGSSMMFLLNFYLGSYLPIKDIKIVKYFWGFYVPLFFLLSLWRVNNHTKSFYLKTYFKNKIIFWKWVVFIYPLYNPFNKGLGVATLQSHGNAATDFKFLIWTSICSFFRLPLLLKK